MKRLSKILALSLALCMVLSAGAFASGDPSGEAAGIQAGSYTDGVNTLVVAEDGTFTMDKTGQNMEGEDFVLTLTGTIAADGTITIDGMFDGDINLIDLATEEQMADDLASVQSALAAGAATGLSAEEAYVEYIHEFLLAELEVNSSMTIDQIEDEFMPLIEAGDYTSFPADMLYSGMLNSGVAMSFEEFAAQYVPAAAGGDTSEDAYHAYLKEYVAAVPAVSDDQFAEFAALIDASDYTTMPADMLFNATWWGYAAMTYDEFVAANGVYEIPAFDPGLTAD
jgi:hypothetical protein